ncbi:MAG TPA: ribosome maturation factor RimP [bacterium]|nr:ribosome maturation factor RimP [bacterium]
MGLSGEPRNAQLRDLAEAVVKDNFLELFDLRVRPQGQKLVLTVVLDKKSGPVTLDDCTAVSRDLEKRLDELNLIETAYLLEVSSPGLDRPLRHLEDCRRFQGRLAQFILKEPLEGQVSFEGRLGETDGEKVEVKVGKERTLWVPFSAVKNAKLMVEL